MDIKLRILSVTEADHSMVVRFWTDRTTEDELATTFKYDEQSESWVIDRTEEGFPKGCRTDQSITVFQVPAPTGDELVKFLVSFAPVHFFELQEKVKDPEIDTSLLTAKDLMKQEIATKFEWPTPPAPPVEEPRSPQPVITPEEIDSLIEEYLKAN